ncbi:MAG: MFS transporter [Dehalococcoidia bacterium]|nr:MAG: MFS transporter [Dehalococcoidia bacterium]
MTSVENYASPSKKPKVFYGYWIVAATFFCAFMDSACGYYSFSLFVTPLEADFGWGRGTIMAAWTFRFLGMGLASPFFGRLVDRWGSRKVIPIGAIIGGLGFVLLAQTTNLWYFYIGWAVVGIGMAGSGLIPGTAVVSRWFKKRRGMALGIMGVGFGAGGILSPLIGGYLIPNFGWSASYFALAWLMWILIPLAILVIRTKPSDMGLHPDGVEEPETKTEAATESSSSSDSGMTLKMALVSSSFWLIGISYLISSMGETGITQSQVPFLEDIGFPVALAATTLAVVGIWSAIGKFAFGWLCDRIPVKIARAIGIGFLLVGAIILTSVQPGSLTVLIWLYTILKGFGTGSWMATMSMLTSTTFGLASYGLIFGMVTILMSIGNAIGPLLGGFMYDFTGSYYGAFIVFIIMLALAIPTILAVRRPKFL